MIKFKTKSKNDINDIKMRLLELEKNSNSLVNKIYNYYIILQSIEKKVEFNYFPQLNKINENLISLYKTQQTTLNKLKELSIRIPVETKVQSNEVINKEPIKPKSETNNDCYSELSKKREYNVIYGKGVEELNNLINNYTDALLDEFDHYLK